MSHGHFDTLVKGGAGSAPVGGFAVFIPVHWTDAAGSDQLFQQLEGFDVFIAGQAQGEVRVHGHHTAVGGRRENSPVVGIDEESIGAFGQLALQFYHVFIEGFIVPLAHSEHFTGIIFHAGFFDHGAVEHQAFGAGEGSDEAIAGFAGQAGILKGLGHIHFRQRRGNVGQRVVGRQVHHPHGGQVVGHVPGGSAAGNGQDPLSGHIVPLGSGGVEFKVAVVGFLDGLVAGQPGRLVHVGYVLRIGVHSVPHAQLHRVALQVELAFVRQRGGYQAQHHGQRQYQTYQFLHIGVLLFYF